MVAIARALDALRIGRPIVVVDDDGRARLALPAATASAADIAFMTEHGASLVSAVMPARRLDALALPSQPATRAGVPDIAITVDLIDGVTTGISAADRALTLRALADPRSTASQFCRPGHIVPVRCVAGGVLLKRDGHHAALDLAVLAGAGACVAMDTLVRRDGELLTGPALAGFAADHDLPLVTVAQVVTARRDAAPLVTRQASARVPMAGGVYTMHGFTSTYDHGEHVALSMGFLRDLPPHLIRTHVHCWTGSIAGSFACDCRARLDASLAAVAAAGRGVVVVLHTKTAGVQLTCASGSQVDAALAGQILDELSVSMSAAALRIPTSTLGKRTVVTVAAPILELAS